MAHDEGAGSRLLQAWSLSLGLIALALLLIAGVPVLRPSLSGTHLVAVGGAALASALMPAAGLRLRVGRESQLINVDEIPIVLGLVLLPLPAVVLGSALGIAVRYARHRTLPMVKRAFNIGASLLGLVNFALIFHALIASEAVASQPGTWGAVLLASLSYALTTGLCSVLVMRLVQANGAIVAFLRLTLITSSFNATACLVALMLLEANPAAIWMLVVLGAAMVVGYRAYDQMQRRHDELAQLTAFNQRMGERSTSDKIALEVLNEVRTVLHAEVAELVVHGEEPWRLVARGDEVPLKEHDITRSFGLRVAPLGFERPVLAPRGSRRAEDRRLLETLGLRDALVVPLLAGGKTVGSLLVADRIGDTETFGHGDAELLQAMASQAHAALQAGDTAARLAVEEQRIARTMTQDPLTGLANRRTIDASLGRLLAARGQAAVLLVDLANFKRVNDTLGHDVADELLIETARRLRAALAGRALLGRVGADVFVVCLGSAEPRIVEQAIEHLRSTLAIPVLLGDLSVDVTTAVGVALAPLHGEDPSTLLRHAEVALGEAKRTTDGIVTYASERDASAPWQLMVVGELRRAIDNGELTCAYQPKVDLRTGAVRGVEALARWTHHERGSIPPVEFVAVAEENGLIGALTRDILSQALRQAAAWAVAGHRIPVAVNISAKGLQEGLVRQVARLLEVHRVVPGMLTLELTESCVMEDPARTERILEQLSGLGVRLSVDDFGTGYSSLSYLARLPVDEIKIDRSFVMAMREEQAAQAVVTATIALALQLGCDVVAEGVEDADAARALARLGCATGQGYHWARPLDREAATRWIAAHDRRAPAPRGRSLPVDMI